MENNEIVYEYKPFLRVYKDGRKERILVKKCIPPSMEDPKTGVSSKDVIITPEVGVSSRIYLPKFTKQQKQINKRFPLLLYFHGGAFCVHSPSSPLYHNYISSLVAEANVVVLSVGFRLVPEHHLPVAYDDSWEAIVWVLSHSTGHGSESWLNNYVDFNRVFMGGDSAGANISHNMAMRLAGTHHQMQVSLIGFQFYGVVLIHPYFWDEKPIGSEEKDMYKKIKMDKLWPNICPSSTGYDDLLINPYKDPNLSSLGCKKVLVCVAEKDLFRDRGWLYFETLRNSEWNGVVEIVESQGEDHVFHLLKPDSEKAMKMKESVISFLNHQQQIPSRI
ncbi:probable carboxylesterase 2 [Papaver somniferum]|uniref:probable carboxylesterase 2 n=1 Tax=Papaver somniferum TaxID=3469 RepID=UPI000E704B4F|nr:probable carboxylesterase 2 [Papaver somniferum]